MHQQRLSSIMYRFTTLLFGSSIGLAGVTYTTIDFPGSSGSTVARGINEKGQIVGSYVDNQHPGNYQHGFLYDSGGGAFTSLEYPNPEASTVAYGINNNGQIVGTHSYNYTPFARGFLYENSIFTTLDFPGAIETRALGVNDLNQIVGVYKDANGVYYNFIYETGAFRTITFLGGGAYTNLYSSGINISGHIVGTTSPVGGFLNDGSRLLSIQFPGAFWTGGAYGINDDDQIVGVYQTATGEHGFLYDHGELTSITYPGAVNNTEAYGINNTGQIVGFYNDGGGNHGFLLSMGPQDQAPPTTAVTIAPLANVNNWNRSDVTITLKATDNPGGTGVKQIQFALGGAQNTGWQTVAGSAASITISAEGTTVLSYFAADDAGNQEATKTLTIRIDKTPPAISGMPAAGCSLWPPNHKLVTVATVTAADALSGIGPGSFQITAISNESSGAPEIVITPTVTGGYRVELMAERLARGTGRVYTIDAKVSDLAGNTATATVSCTVPHDQGSS